MSILIAVGEENLSSILRNHFENARMDVIDNDILHRNYLNEVIELEHPTMVILHDYYLPSDLTDQTAQEEEILELLNAWRVAYDDKLRVVYLCERDRRDPFLGKLVAHNVLDIFNERQILVDVFVEQLSEPARFSNVSKFGVGGLEIEFEEQVEEETSADKSKEETAPVVEVSKPKEKQPKPSAPKGQKTKELLQSVNGRLKTVREAGEEWNQQRIKDKEVKASIPKETKPKKEKPSLDVSFDELIDLMPIPKEVYRRPQVVGTVVIAVGGVQAHLGATHTAMSIASFLQKRQHSVALIELNDSEDFERIHALYEGEEHFIRKDTKFSYKGIDHYKYREELRLWEIIPTYEYVVLDVGAIENSAYLEEFKRAHIRCVLVSPYEWKEHWIKQFGEQVRDAEHYTYITPFAGKSTVRDMQERFPNLHIVPFTADENPYSVKEDRQIEIVEILDGFLKEDKKGFSQKTVILTSVISIAITLLLFTTFKWL